MKTFVLASLLLVAAGPAAFASTINLGIARSDGSVEALTKFDKTYDKYVSGSNALAYSPDSEAENRTSLGKNTAAGPETSVYAHSEADTLKGGSIGAEFTSSGHAEANLDYHFEIVGPIDTQVLLTVQAVASISVTGDFTSTAGGANAEAILYLAGQDVNVQRDAILEGHTSDGNTTLHSGFDASGIYVFDTNTPYEVQIRAVASAAAQVNDFARSYSNFYATASLDPVFTVDPPFSSQFHIVYATGIGTSPVPLPASAPLFGAALAALGAVGCSLKRRKAAAAA